MQELLKKNKGIKKNIGRRDEQQDHACGKRVPVGYLVAVCDGVGGEQGGAVASHLAIEVISKNIEELPRGANDWQIRENISEALRAANQAIIDAARDNIELRGMATTVALALFAPQGCFVCHAGDSRVYQIRGRRIVFRTIDHNEVEDKIKLRQLKRRDAKKYENPSITRYLGRKDSYHGEIKLLPYQQEDIFLLCSDGIYGEIKERDLLRMIHRYGGQLDEAADAVIDHILVEAPEDKRLDNMTIAIVQTKAQSYGVTTSSDQRKPINQKVLALALSTFVGCVLLFLLVGWILKPNEQIQSGQQQQFKQQLAISNGLFLEITKNAALASDSLVLIRKQQLRELIATYTNEANDTFGLLPNWDSEQFTDFDFTKMENLIGDLENAIKAVQ